MPRYQIGQLLMINKGPGHDPGLHFCYVLAIDYDPNDDEDEAMYLIMTSGGVSFWVWELDLFDQLDDVKHYLCSDAE